MLGIKRGCKVLFLSLKDKMKARRVFILPLILLNILMLIYFLSLAYYNRFSQDDFLFLSSIKNNTVLKFVFQIYLCHSGRFSMYFFNGCVYHLLLNGFPLWTYQIFVLIFCTIVVFYFLKHFFEASFLIFNVALFTVNIFIFVNFEFSAFYWICATSYYIMAVLPLIIYLLINSKKKDWKTYSFLFLVSAIISGSSEVFAPICLILLFINFIFLFFREDYNLKQIISLPETKKILFSSFIILIGFIVILSAPGNQNRMEEFSQSINLLSIIKISLKSFVLYFYLFLFKIPYLLPLFLISMVLAFYYKANFTLKKLKLLYVFLLFFVFIFFNVLPVSYVLSGFGFHRIYTHTVLYTIFFICIMAFIWGLKIKEKYQNKIKLLSIISFFVLSISIVYHVVTDIPSAKEYSQSLDRRVNYLFELKEEERKDVVELDSLSVPYTTSFKYNILKLIGKQKNPRPVLYYSNEITTDIYAYNNQNIENYYQLDFPIKLKE